MSQFVVSLVQAACAFNACCGTCATLHSLWALFQSCFLLRFYNLNHIL